MTSRKGSRLEFQKCHDLGFAPLGNMAGAVEQGLEDSREVNSTRGFAIDNSLQERLITCTQDKVVLVHKAVCTSSSEAALNLYLPTPRPFVACQAFLCCEAATAA